MNARHSVSRSLDKAINLLTKARSSRTAVPMAIDIPDGPWKRMFAATDFLSRAFREIKEPRRSPAAAKSCGVLSADGPRAISDEC